MKSQKILIKLRCLEMSELEEKKKRKKAGSESSKESSLRDWFKRKGAKGKKGGWVDCNAPDGKGGYKSCGRSSGEKRKKYPACRPTPGACKERGRGKSWGKKGSKKKRNESMQMTTEEIKSMILEELQNVLDEKKGKKRAHKKKAKKSGGKRDACYHKVKRRYKVWPSAYASGALTKCRKVGAANWGNKSKKNESLNEEQENFDKMMNALDKEGGAAGMDALMKHTNLSKEKIKDLISNNKEFVTHQEGDVIEMTGIKGDVEEAKKKKPCKPSKGKRFAKRVNGKCRSFGQKGQAKGGGDRIRPGTKKGDAYCARSAKIKKCKNPPCANDLSRKKWKCRGSKSMREQNEETMSPYHDKLITLITSGEESLKQALELFSAIKGTGMLQPHEEDHIQRLSEYADVQYSYKSVVKEMSALRKEFGVAARSHKDWRRLARERVAALRSMRELEQNINPRDKRMIAQTTDFA